jgi:predicted nucleic acid-binding protein
LLKLAHNKEEEILTSLEVILKRITLINEETISFLSRKRAYEFVKDIDLKDLPFVALALELDAFLWTGDKKLQDGLKSKGFNKFFLLKKVLR